MYIISNYEFKSGGGRYWSENYTCKFYKHFLSFVGLQTLGTLFNSLWLAQTSSVQTFQLIFLSKKTLWIYNNLTFIVLSLKIILDY